MKQTETTATALRARQHAEDSMNRTLSRFTRAVVARHAPHLCPVQAATLRSMSLHEFDAWVNTLEDAMLAELVLWLQDREVQMQSLLACVEVNKVPAAVEYLSHTLAVDYRVIPLGKVLTMPPMGRRASSGQEAAAMILGQGLAQKPPGV